MYLLGLVCTYATVPDKRGYHAYSLAPYELFVDIVLLGLLLSMLPHKLGLWIKRALYIGAYLLAIMDVYCFVKFDTTITPTMLLLVGETDSREATEFLRSYITSDLIFSRLGWVLLVLALHIAWTAIWKRRQKTVEWMTAKWPRLLVLEECFGRTKPWMALAAGICLVVCTAKTFGNKVALARLMAYDNIGDVEHEMTRKDKAVLYQPFYRLTFSVYANALTAKQVKKLVDNIDKVAVDSCNYRSRNIVLIIGESFNRHHASL